MNTVRLNGIQLAFEDIGSGSLVLLLIRGHPFDHTMWRPQFEPMPAWAGGDLAKAAKVYAGTQPLTAEDIADTVAWIASRAPQVNINTIELMPIAQRFAGFQVHRT